MLDWSATTLDCHRSRGSGYGQCLLILILILMLAEPVQKELRRRAIAQRGVVAPPVVEDRDVLEQVSLEGLTSCERDISGAAILPLRGVYDPSVGR